jgi:hypothetical protein
MMDPDIKEAFQDAITCNYLTNIPLENKPSGTKIESPLNL